MKTNIVLDNGNYKGSNEMYTLPFTGDDFYDMDLSGFDLIVSNPPFKKPLICIYK